MSGLTRFCLISGSGRDSHRISSFDSSLLDAGVGNYNLVRVSSILPPHCTRTCEIQMPTGSVLFTAYATLTSCSNETIASAIAVAIPQDLNECGVIMEYSSQTTRENAIRIVTDLANAAMLKRHIAVSSILSAGIEMQGDNTMFCTTFAGIAMF